mmetsp:Transcript_16897/g.45794  ORF Transcript_16897/g.45794 Transcript_16897/m.45794 type:complete len:206 (+) Transcript_16897:860-1477(+)
MDLSRALSTLPVLKFYDVNTSTAILQGKAQRLDERHSTRPGFVRKMSASADAALRVWQGTGPKCLGHGSVRPVKDEWHQRWSSHDGVRHCIQVERPHIPSRHCQQNVAWLHLTAPLCRRSFHQRFYVRTNTTSTTFEYHAQRLCKLQGELPCGVVHRSIHRTLCSTVSHFSMRRCVAPLGHGLPRPRIHTGTLAPLAHGPGETLD